MKVLTVTYKDGATKRVEVEDSIILKRIKGYEADPMVLNYEVEDLEDLDHGF